jgi:hypothetical protein
MEVPAQTDFTRLAELTAGLGLHQHIYLIYGNQEEPPAAAVPYLRVGLARAEKRLYVADENSLAKSCILCADARLPSIITCAGA